MNVEAHYTNIYVILFAFIASSLLQRRVVTCSVDQPWHHILAKCRYKRRQDSQVTQWAEVRTTFPPLLATLLSIEVTGRWRGMLGWASPAACECVEWWPRWAWVMKHWLSGLFLYLDLAPPMVLISWVFGPAALLLCDVPRGLKLHRLSSFRLDRILCCRVKHLNERYSKLQTHQAILSVALKVHLHTVVQAAYSFSSMLEPSGPLQDHSVRLRGECCFAGRVKVISSVRQWTPWLCLERYFSRNVCCSEDTSVSVWLDVFVCFFVQDALCSTQRLREFTVWAL